VKASGESEVATPTSPVSTQQVTSAQRAADPNTVDVEAKTKG
jgi:hypothetical protein